MNDISSGNKERLRVISEHNRGTMWLVEFMIGEPDVEEHLKPELEDMSRKLTEVGSSLRKLLGQKMRS